MKTYFRSFLITVFSLWLVFKLVDGVKLDGDWQNFVLLTGGLFVSSLFIKPIVKLIFLPFNLVTFNTISIFVTAISIYLLDFFIPEFKVTGFTFKGLNYNGIVLPQAEINQLATLLVAAIIITVVSAILNWLAN